MASPAPTTANQLPEQRPLVLSLLPAGRDISWLAIAASMFVHLALALLAAAALLGVRIGPAGPGVGAGAGVNVELMEESPLLSGGGSGLEAELPSLGSGAPVADLGDLSLDGLASAATDAAFVSADLGSADDLDASGGGMSGGGSIGDGFDLGSGGGGGGGASFFGVEARGVRFVYIVDNSGSMAGAPLETLKDAIISSINGLSENAEFCIILYNSQARSLFPVAEWISADESQKSTAKSLINAIVSGGGTNPLPGFEIAFQLRARPDAIYFMTDGQFGEQTEAALLALVSRSSSSRGEKKTPIHCITFLDASAAAYMKRLARVTGGTYTHVGSNTP